MRGLLRGALLCAVVVLASSAGAADEPVTGWLTFGGGPERLGVTADAVSTSRHAWFYPAASTITTQPLVARNVPRSGDLTIYVGAADGKVYAFAPNGYVRWRVDLGHLTHTCPQIPDGWGVTGTPTIDPGTRTLYVVDAFGRMHGLDLATGAERDGWPVLLFADDKEELGWGASLLLDGSIYVGTGSYCDGTRMEGKLLRVRIDTKEVTSWTSVPFALGGGGGVWGWGGPSYSAVRGSLFVGTGNAYRGGANVGPAFDEQAGYAEHVVELSRDLEVRSSAAPRELRDFPDNAFVGAPVLVSRAGCAELVAAQTKSGMLYLWRTDGLAAGPVATLKLQPANAATPLITEPAYAPALESLFVVTASELDRIAIGADCRPAVQWRLKLGRPTLYGSPLVAGNVVWVAYPTRDITDRPEVLLGVDARNGKVVSKRSIGGISFAQPTAVDGMLFLGAMHGFSGRAFPVARGRPASRLPEYSSNGWVSREDGVFAGSRRIFGSQAVRVLRTSAKAGVLAVGATNAACACTTRRVVTLDGGRTWRQTRAIGGSFAGRGSALFWWAGGSLYRVVKWPVAARRIASRRVAATDGTIVATALVPDGVAALVDRGAKPPQVIVAHGSSVRVQTLPAAAGAQTVVRRIAAAWPSLTVTGTDYSHPTAAPDPEVRWSSRDGGRSFALEG